jgi:hypothetical protein
MKRSHCVGEVQTADSEYDVLDIHVEAGKETLWGAPRLALRRGFSPRGNSAGTVLKRNIRRLSHP